MPFEHLIPRPLAPLAIQAYAPMASGVYGISNAREWIYIGETDDIRGALLTHLSEYESPLMQSKPAGFVFEVCDRGRTLVIVVSISAFLSRAACAARPKRGIVISFSAACSSRSVMN